MARALGGGPRPDRAREVSLTQPMRCALYVTGPAAPTAPGSATLPRPPATLAHAGHRWLLRALVWLLADPPPSAVLRARWAGVPRWCLVGVGSGLRLRRRGRRHGLARACRPGPLPRQDLTQVLATPERCAWLTAGRKPAEGALGRATNPRMGNVNTWRLLHWKCHRDSPFQHVFSVGKGCLFFKNSREDLSQKVT